MDVFICAAMNADARRSHGFCERQGKPGESMGENALIEALPLVMFAVSCILLMLGFPVAFTLAGTALAFALVGSLIGILDPGFLLFFPQRIFSIMTNDVLIAVPLFVFMGVMLERSKVAEALLETMGQVFGGMRGGLGIAVSIVGALLAASTGIVGATVVTMGLLSLPTMLRYGYNHGLAAGSICAAGTLGQIIPPSIVLVFLGDVISSAYQESQLRQGIFAPDALTVGDLFAGALIPGLVLAGLYILYQLFVALVRPSWCPAITDFTENFSSKGLGKRVLFVLLPPVLLIVAVLGSILAGIATPTEAAAMGAVGSILLAGASAPGVTRAPALLAALAVGGLLVLNSIFDLRVGRDNISAAEETALYVAIAFVALITFGLSICLRRAWRAGFLAGVMRSTTQITSMVFVILIGATLFSLVFVGLKGDELVHGILSDMPGGVTGAVIVVMAVMFFLGFFIDTIEIIFIVVPIVTPVLLMMGVDPLWLGIMMAINLQTSFLTPPFGFALFFLRGVAPPELKTGAIYRGIIPFVMMQIVMLGILAAYPSLATTLPKLVFGE
jgi:tripartite ATP-independent transporter DctM subunit